MISASARRELEQRGLLRLERFVSGGATRQAREALWGELARLKIRVGGKWHLRAFDGVPTFQVAGQIARGLRPLPAFDALFPPELPPLVEALAGTRLVAAEARPSMLITPPQREPWAIPHASWHVDVGSLGAALPGIQAFVLIDDIAPRGGATMALAGSHRLVRAKGGRDRALREHATFRKLFDAGEAEREALLHPHRLGEIELQVVEMTGRAGDVYLMDMRILHAPSTNGSKHPRLSATRRYLKR